MSERERDRERQRGIRIDREKKIETERQIKQTYKRQDRESADRVQQYRELADQQSFLCIPPNFLSDSGFTTVLIYTEATDENEFESL